MSDRETKDSLGLVWRSENGFRISFPATLKHIDWAVQETKTFLETKQAQKHIFDITLVLREGLMNAVIDGSYQDAEKLVLYTILLDDDTLTIEIEDTGNGFDWHGRIGRIPVPQAESGRGLAIMGIYCDSVRFNDKGNKLTLTKSIR
jgi:serine/threonine-protein kinase RsbW